MDGEAADEAAPEMYLVVDAISLKIWRLCWLKRLLVCRSTNAYAAILLLCIDYFLEVLLESLLVKFGLP